MKIIFIFLLITPFCYSSCVYEKNKYVVYSWGIEGSDTTWVDTIFNDFKTDSFSRAGKLKHFFDSLLFTDTNLALINLREGYKLSLNKEKCINYLGRDIKVKLFEINEYPFPSLFVFTCDFGIVYYKTSHFPGVELKDMFSNNLYKNKFSYSYDFLQKVKNDSFFFPCPPKPPE